MPCAWLITDLFSALASDAQAGEEYARRVEAKELAKIEEAEKQAKAAGGPAAAGSSTAVENKKDQ